MVGLHSPGSGLLLVTEISQLDWTAWLTAAVTLGCFVAMAFSLTSPDLALMGGLVVLLVTGVLEPETALDGFSDPALVTVAGLFVVAAAARRTGALAFLGRIMMPRSGHPPTALAHVMIPASVLSSCLNNTPIVAFLTPLVQQWARRVSISASKLLIPLSYATILGGMSTLVGTSTNVVVSSQLEKLDLNGFSMFELAWVGIPASIVGFLYFALGAHRLLPDRGHSDVPALGGDKSYRFDLRVPEGSPFAEKTIEQAGLRALKGAFLAHIVRRRRLIGPVAPTQTLEVGDILTFVGDRSVMDRLLKGKALSRPIELSDEKEATDADLPELPLYEAVVSAASTLVGRSLKRSDFRERFQGVVLGIHRRGKRLRSPIGLTPIEAGDLLLIEARPGFDRRWGQSGEFYLVAPLERESLPASGHAPWVLGIIAAMVILVALSWVPMVTAATAAAFLVVLSGTLNAREAPGTIDFSVLLVIAAALGIGKALQTTGLAGLMAAYVLDPAGGLGLVGVLAVLYLTTNITTELITNNAAAVLILPVGVAAAGDLGFDPRPFAVVIAIAASASFASPIGYQTNLMVMGPGGYRFLDYLRVGLPLNLIVMVLTLAIVPLVWG